jgi:hypothetical protein
MYPGSNSRKGRTIDSANLSLFTTNTRNMEHAPPSLSKAEAPERGAMEGDVLWKSSKEGVR